MTTNISVDNLDLRIGFESSQSRVKTYDLVPDLGIIKGFGVNKEDRDALAVVLSQRKYDRRDCVYLLLSHMSVNYIGASGSIVDRLGVHVSQRTQEKQWDRALVFFLTKPIHNRSLVEFVEHALFLRLTERGFALIQKIPDGRALNPDDQKIARRFVAEIERILALLDMADPLEIVREIGGFCSGDIGNDEMADAEALQSLEESRQEAIEVELHYQGTEATGKYTGFGLEVYAGSIGTAQVKNHMYENEGFWRTRSELEDMGVIEITDDILRFTQNYTFSSPTAAAQILTGSNRPGPLVWRRISDKKSLKELSLR